MNFNKTLPMLVDTIESIKKVSIGYIGSDGLFDSATVKSYVASLQGLSATQAEVVLSSAGMDKAQRKQIISALEATVATKTLTSEEAVSAMTRKMGTETAAKELLIKSKLVTADQLEAGSEFEVSTQKLKSAVASGVLTQEEANNISIALGLTGANIGLGQSFKLLTATIWANIKAMAAWLVTTPAGWATLAIGAIAGTVAIYNALTISLEEAQENLEESSTAFNETTDEIESLNDELKTTEERIKELQKLSDSGTISVADEAELELLKEKNKELARQIALKQRDQIIEGKKTLEDAQELSTKTVTSKYEIEAVGVGKDSRTVYADVSVEKELQNAIDKYNQVKELLNRDDLTEQQREYWEGILGDAEERASEMQGILDAERQAYLDLENAGMALTPEDKERLEFLNDIDDSYLLWNHTLTQTRESFIALNEEQQKSILLNRLLKQGLSDEQANAVLGNIDSSNYNDLWDKDFTFTPPEMTDYATAEEYGKAYATAWLEGVKVVTNTEQTFGITEKFKEELDNTFSNQSTFQSAFDKIQEGTSLTADEVRELVELYPSLADEFEKTADGWTIASQDLIDANDEMIKNTKDSIREQISNYQKLIDTYENSRESILNKTYLPSDAPNAQLSNIPYTSEEVEEARKQIEFLNLTLSMFGLASDNAVDKLDVLNKKYDEVSDTTSNLVNKAKSLSDAFAEQNENGSLSTETVLSLIENGYAAALMYDAETGAIRLNAQAYLDLANAEIEAQIAELTLAKNDAAKTALDEQRNVVSNLGWSYLDTAQAALEMAKAQEIISNANADVSNYDAQIKALEEYKKKLGDITMGTYGGSGSSSDPIKAAFDFDMRDIEHAYNKGLISQEEYLNTLEQANEERYKNSAEHYDDYLANIEKIYNGRKDIFKSTVDEQIKALDEQLEKGFISSAQYQSEMTKLMEQSYGMGSKYYGTEFATENYNEMSDMIEDKDVDVYESKLEELKKANDGSIEAERQFIEKWKSLNKKMFEDSDPKKYKENLEEIDKYEDDWLVRRTENEKTYWENLKQEAIDYYDKEIEKLREIADEEERISKEKELQNNLIKAKQRLEEAKKNRNQLIFRNGIFEYVENQEEVRSATEEVNDSQKAIDEYNRKKEIEYWEKRKEQDEDFYDALLLKINNYIDSLDGNVLPTSSDSEVISKAGATDEANKAQNAYDSLGKDDKSDTSTEVKTDTVVVEQTGQPASDNTGIQGTKQLYTIDEAAKILADRLGVSVDSDVWKNFATSVVSNSNPQSSPLSGIQNQNVYNNSTVDNSIRIGTINNNVTVAEGTTKQQVQSMLDGFASEVVGSLKSLRTKTT